MGAAEDELLKAVARLAKVEADMALLREQVVGNQRRIHELERAVMCGDTEPPSSLCEPPPPEIPPPAPPPVVKPPAAGVQAPPWLLAMRARIGHREIPGGQHDPWIVAAHAALGLPDATDETAWCSSGLAAVMREVGVSVENVTPMARSWMRWGKPLPSPVLGCVVVLQPAGHGGHWHVTLFEDLKTGRILGLGANQKDRIGRDWYDASRVPNGGYRWPA